MPFAALFLAPEDFPLRLLEPEDFDLALDFLLPPAFRAELFFVLLALLLLDFFALDFPRTGLDFLVPADFETDRLPAFDGLGRRAEDFFALDFLPPLFFGEDFPDPIPVARLVAPTAWVATLETAAFALATFCGSFAALPAIAPSNPPTTAPIGPATAPTTAPAAAPAVVFEIECTSRLSDDLFSEDCWFGSSAIILCFRVGAVLFVS